MAVLRGAVDTELADEFPGIGLLSAAAERDEPSPPGLLMELALLAERISGPVAVQAAAEPVAAAYRALRVQWGMSADAGEGTLEGLMRRRLLEGGFRSQGRTADAITIATFETGVPIWALPIGPAPLRLGVDHLSGTVSLLRGSEPVRQLFAQSPPPAKGAASELAALIAPGLDPRFAEAALERAVDLASIPRQR